MKEVADNVYRLGSRSHNFFLIREQGEYTMIDAGCSREWSQVVEALEALNSKVTDIAAVVATHVHADHLGLGPKASEAGIDISVHEEEQERALGTYEGRFAAKPTELPMFSLRALRNMLPMVLAGVMSMKHMDVVGTFSDGDVLDVPGRPRVIHTPGHTEGHSMFLAEGGILFTGDGLITMDLLGNSTTPQLIGDVFSLDPAQARDSLGRLEGLETQLLLPGHGDPWAGNAAAAVEIALA